MSDHGHDHAPKAADSPKKSSHHESSSDSGLILSVGVGSFFSSVMGLFTQFVSSTVNSVLECNFSGGGGGGGGGHDHGHGH